MRSFAVFMFAFLLFAPVILTGCGEEAEPETVVEPPPPPTAEEIKTQILLDTKLNAGVPPKGAVPPPGAGQAFVSQMRAIHAQHMLTPEGKEALMGIQRELEGRFPIMEERELWQQILIVHETHQIFSPGSTRYDRLKEKAIIELKKPRVKFGGIHDKDGLITAFLSFHMPLTREDFSEQMRPGEVKHGMKFVGVIGNNRGVEMEYLETGERSKVTSGNG